MIRSGLRGWGGLRRDAQRQSADQKRSHRDTETQRPIES
jgi:hypothetical protein